MCWSSRSPSYSHDQPPVEGLATDQGKCPAQVGDPVGAAGLAADPESSEQVRVDEQSLDLVDPDSSGLGGGRFSCVGQVLLSCSGVGPEPVPQGRNAGADAADGDPEGIGELRGGRAVRVRSEVGQQLDEVRLALGDRDGVAAGAGADRTEQGQAGKVAVL